MGSFRIFFGWKIFLSHSNDSRLDKIRSSHLLLLFDWTSCLLLGLGLLLLLEVVARLDHLPHTHHLLLVWRPCHGPAQLSISYNLGTSNLYKRCSFSPTTGGRPRSAPSFPGCGTPSRTWPLTPRGAGWPRPWATTCVAWRA